MSRINYVLHVKWVKQKEKHIQDKDFSSSKGRLNLLHMDLCGPRWIESINRKKYILVIVENYSRYTWTHFLRTKDETPEVINDFLKMIQRNLQAQVITVRTNKGTKFLNKTLHAYFKEEGIEYQTSTPQTPEQNRVVERRNRTLVEGFMHFDEIVYAVKGYRVYNKRIRLIVETIHINFDEIKELSKASDYDNSGPVRQLQKTSDHNRQNLAFKTTTMNLQVQHWFQMFLLKQTQTLSHYKS
nr:putative ribonuclease H-like domain-containing protein [Tanacetum cinerariifolium]